MDIAIYRHETRYFRVFISIEALDPQRSQVKYREIAVVVAYKEGKLGLILPLLKSSRPAAVANGKSCGSDSSNE
jgi:hypothetical protein